MKGGARSVEKAQALALARAVLTMNVRPQTRLDDDGCEAQILALMFQTGVHVTDEGGEAWVPPPYVLEPGAGNFGLVAKAYKEGRVRFTAAHLGGIITQAKSKKLARLACKRLAGQLASQGATVPRDLLAALEESGPMQRGPNPGTNVLRDNCIIAAVQAMLDCGFQLYRNDESGGRSAAESFSAIALVSEALLSLRVSLSYSGVRDVWERETDRAVRGKSSKARPV